MSDHGVNLSHVLADLPSSLGGHEVSDLIERLFRDDDSTGLLLLLDGLLHNAVSSWRQTERASEDEVAGARTQSLLPSIRCIGRVCVDALRFRHPMVYQEGIEGLARVYNLARSRDLGVRRGDAELGWSAPSQAALTEFYLLGSYATFRHRMKYVRPLLDARIDQPKARSRSCVTVLTHPYFDHRWQGGRLSHYDEAASLIKSDESLFLLFLADEEPMTNSLCQFDFIVAYALHCRGEEIGYWNFCRRYPYRVMPAIERLLEPESYSVLFGSFEPQRFADFLRQVGNMCARRTARGNEWGVWRWTGRIEQFLESYPPEEA